jgi:hypothetical protein
MDKLDNNLRVVPWSDATVESLGFGARSDYVEWFWLPVLGPSATWLLRRIDFGFEDYPDGYVLDSQATSRALGVAAREHAGAIFGRAVSRLQMFGVAQSGRGALAVRRVLPPVSQRHLDRMPPHLREAHEGWLRRSSDRS